MFLQILKRCENGKNGEKLDDQISHGEYLTCKKIWDVFKMKNMRDYHDHYFGKGVLLLADVFERFIDTCMNFYGIDPCHCFSFPGLSWDAMLKMTEIEFEKIEGISYIAKIIC